MAWVDDRIWCHPKIVPLSDKAKIAYLFGIAYSSGMGTAGRIEAATQKLIGATPKTRSELVAAGLWHLNGDGQSIVINDWEEHNGLRDEKRKRDLERKRTARREGRWNEKDR